MKSIRSLLLGGLILVVLCCSLLATAPWNYISFTLPPDTIPLGVAVLDDSPDTDEMIPLGMARLNETP